MKTNLFLVASPLQTLCALEASLRHPNDNNVIVCHLSSVPGRELNDNQIESILSYGQWADIEVFKPRVPAGRFSVHIGFSKLLRKLNKKYLNSIDRLFLGEFRSRWMHLARIAVEPKSTWLIDDGSESIIAIDKYIKNGKFIHDKIIAERNFLKAVCFRVIYGRYQKESCLLKTIPVNVFSAFLALDGNGEDSVRKNTVRMVRNDFKKTREMFSTVKSVSHADKIVYYYGSKYSEAGVVSLEYELEFLETLKKFYSNLGLQVRYFSHRDESEIKLMQVEKIFPRNVERSLEMAEVSLLRSITPPAEIAAAYSSVLQNLNIIFPEIKITSFKFEGKNVNSMFRDDVESAYAYYNQVGITVVDLP